MKCRELKWSSLTKYSPLSKMYNLESRSMLNTNSKQQQQQQVVRWRRKGRRRVEEAIKTTRGKIKSSSIHKFEMFCIMTTTVLLLLLQHKSIAVDADSAPRITIQPNDLIAIEGESAELNCDADGQPEPTIEWYHNGQLIKTSTSSRTTMGGSIQFLDIRPPLSSINSNSNSNGNGNSNSKQYQTSDTGVYYCLARNSLGHARSRNASLQVAYIKSEFRIPPKDKLVSIGETVTFDCLPQAWPEPNIQWRHNSQLIEPHELRLTDGSAKYSINRIAKTDLNLAPEKLPSTQAPDQSLEQQPQSIDVFGSRLVIKDVDKSDQGRYSCLVETKGSHKLIERESPSAQLTALVKPYFIEAPEHKSVEVGSQVQFKCRVGGDPEPVISWRKQNGQPLSEKTQIDPVDKTLILDKVTIADQAVYVCEGENSIGSARTMAKLSVNSRPKFIVQPENLDVDQGSRAQLKCSGEASPPPMLFWYKEGHRQLMFAPNPPAATPSLSTLKREFPDWPQASALVVNDYRSSSPLSDISPAVNKLFSMPVNYDQLSTSSYGNNYFGNRIYVDNQGTLNLINVTNSDTGYYACALISSVGSVMAKAKLTVRQSLSIPSSASDYYNSVALQDTKTSNSVSKFDLLPPPVIKLGAANQTLPTNTSATLVCDVVSQVAYKFQWLFESQPLQEEPGRVFVLDTGGLSINNLKISDSGIYTCVVTAANDQVLPLATPFEPLEASMLTSAPPTQQSTSHSTMLKVASPMNPNIQFYRMDTYAYPSSPGPAYLVSTNGNDAITIAWSPPAESGSLPIKEYVVEHYDTYLEHSGWKEIYRVKGKESLFVDGLSSDGSHFFVIRAANSHGTGPSSPIAGPMRTVAGEARYQTEQRRRAPADFKKFDTPMSTSMQEDRDLIRERLKTISTNLLSVTAVSSTSIRIQWLTQEIGNFTTGVTSPLLGMPDVSDFVQGYSILYRAIGMGESLIKDPLIGMNWNAWSNKEMKSPTSLPLVTSYVDEEPVSREKRDLTDYFDYSKDYSEVRVVDHKTEHYTINGLQPFTLYQFFVTPYYQDIDGVPSNFLTGQTHEGKPGIAPPNLTIRPINNTAVKLLWRPIPPPFTNGLLKGYILRVNRGDILINNSIQLEQQVLEHSGGSKIINLSLSSLSIAPVPTFPPDNPIHPNSFQGYIVIYDLANLTYKSFYSVQVAGATAVGAGPWSEPENFIMDPKVLSQTIVGANDFEDVLSKSLVTNVPQNYGKTMSPGSNIYLIVSISLIVVSIITILGFLLYRRNNQKVITWKKTISDHFTNKFYMHPTVDHRGSNSLQQNIYDHQQHLIYSGNPHMPQQIIPTQPIWSNNNCINSSGTGSLSSHGGLIPVQNDPNSMTGRINNDQHLMMNKAEINTRFAKNQLTNQPSVDSSRPLIGHNQAKHQSDYYSVINSMAEYEELDPQQRSSMHLVTNSDRHQTASSNSDTSCPSSVTRLLPNQNCNRDLLTKNFNDIQRTDIILQQQVVYNSGGGKQPFATMVTTDTNRVQSLVPLSPYATTNLMNQGSIPQQVFSNSQTGLIDHSRQQNFVMHNNGGLTMDDSSKVLVNHHHQQVNGVSNPISLFRTLQRNPVHFQSRNQQFSQAHQPQVFIPGDNSFNRFQNQNLASVPTTSVMANITTNPMNDIRSNVYEHVDYSDPAAQNQQLEPAQRQLKLQQLNSQVSSNNNNIISSSTSSGSMKSSSQQHSPDQQTNLNKLRRGSNATFESEAHDLHVFSTPHESARVDAHSKVVEERPRFVGEHQMVEENHEDDERNQVDETTAFKRKSSQSDNQRARQLSKRKRQQQRNRLHNNNQNIG